MPSKNLVVTITILVAGLTILRIAAGLLVDWLWFSSVAYASVFWTIIGAKAGLLCIVFFGPISEAADLHQGLRKKAHGRNRRQLRAALGVAHVWR